MIAKKFALLVCALVVAWPFGALAQNSENVVRMPLIVVDWGGDIMGSWKVVAPEATVNMALNPSAEIAGNYATAGGGTVTRVTTYQKYGVYSFRVQTAADNQGASFTLAALSNAIHYVTLRVRGTLPAAWDWSLDDSTYTAPTLLESEDADWDLYGLQLPAVQAVGSTALYIRQNGAGAGDFYIDGVQVEAKEYWTTYVDGVREGCAWTGTPHASHSSRSAASRAGGRVRDLRTDYSFGINGMVGLGSPPQSVTIDEYSLVPGGEVNSVKVHPRVFALTGYLFGTSESNLDAIRQALSGVLMPDAYPKDEFGWQPVRLIYTGGASIRQISAHYEGGLEGNVLAKRRFTEAIAIRFISTDNPFWEDAQGAESAAVLDPQNLITLARLMLRSRTAGVWSALGGNAGIWAFAEDSRYLYIGGEFTDLGGVANADRIARYEKATGTITAMGTGADAAVWAVARGPDGRIYIGGDFHNVGGVACAHVAVWSGSAWAALGAGVNDTCMALAFSHSGLLYAAGSFTTAGGGAALRVASWNGTAWAALGGGVNGAVRRAIAIDAASRLYIGGDFTTAGGAAANRIAMWNPDTATWSALGTGMDDTVWTLAMSKGGILYAGGEFTTAGGITVGRIAAWNGTSWSALGEGVYSSSPNVRVNGISIGQDGTVWVAGYFDEAGGLTTAGGLARWNGTSWSHTDIDLDVWAESVWASLYTDPVVVENYDVFVGVYGAGDVYCAGIATATNSGTTVAYPKIVIARNDLVWTGSEYATIYSVRNETIGKELLFDYALSNGEELTIDLDPLNRSVVSSMFGDVPQAVLANSDFGEFVLQPGANSITCLVDIGGTAVVTANAIWQRQYR